MTYILTFFAVLIAWKIFPAFWSGFSRWRTSPFEFYSFRVMTCVIVFMYSIAYL